jgi:hypothetical protein
MNDNWIDIDFDISFNGNIKMKLRNGQKIEDVVDVSTFKKDLANKYSKKIDTSGMDEKERQKATSDAFMDSYQRVDEIFKRIEKEYEPRRQELIGLFKSILYGEIQNAKSKIIEELKKELDKDE